MITISQEKMICNKVGTTTITSRDHSNFKEWYSEKERRGNLKNHLPKWKNIRSGEFIVDITENGPKLDLIDTWKANSKFVVPHLHEKELNKLIGYKHFKMKLIQDALEVIRAGVYMEFIDLKDAFYQIPAHKNHQTYLISFAEKYLKFVLMPNGNIYKYLKIFYIEKKVSGLQFTLITHICSAMIMRIASLIFGTQWKSLDLLDPQSTQTNLNSHQQNASPT